MSFFQVSPVKLLQKIGITTCEKQNDIIKSVDEFQVSVVKASRRAGKSLVAAACGMSKLMVPDAQVALSAPFSVQCDIIFNNVINQSKGLGLSTSKLNNKERYLKFDWGSELRTSTLKNRSTIVGRANDLFLLDEIALAEYLTDINFMYQEIIPTLLTVDGHILAISTPRGFNYFKELFDTAKKEKNWNPISFTIWDIDHIPKKKIQELKEQYIRAGLEDTWMQEFECSFISFSGAIFDFSPIGRLKEEMPKEGLVVIGVDPGLNTAIVKVVVTDKGVFLTDLYQKKASTDIHGKFLQSIYDDDIDLAICDSAAATFIEDMAYDYNVQLDKSIKAVDDGINFIKRLNGKIFYNVNSGDAEEFINQWNLYSMKNDKVVKKDDHMIDALRYALYTAYRYFPEYFESLLSEELNTEQLLMEAV